MQSIKKIKASNLLSFGPDGLDLELGNLNVLIGANGSGKSNFLEIFSLLRSLPRSSEEFSSNLHGVISRGGGATEWEFKGDSKDKYPKFSAAFKMAAAFINHQIEFYANDNRFSIYSESVANYQRERGEKDFTQILLLDSNPFSTDIFVDGEKRDMTGSFSENYSILSQLRDSEKYPEFFQISNFYEKIRLYREWTFGRKTVFREPQPTDLRNDRLEEDFSNLGLYLNRLAKFPQVKKQLVEHLQNLYEGLEGYEVIIEGGTVQVIFIENGHPISAKRLSDGSLRYLCLLAILLDPTPPPLICIEEPELGMHPDLIPKIADLLKNAAERTQLIITTHSDILIDAMSDRPEDVLVCEKQDGQTKIKRLEKADLTSWLEQYRLGQLWSMGEIGGNRW